MHDTLYLSLAPNDILRMLSCDNSDYRKRRNRKAKFIKNIPVNERQAFTVYLTNRFQIAVHLFTETWNLLVLYNKELKKVLMMTSSMRLSSNRS